MTDEAPKTPVTDAELVVRCQKHDPAAYRVLVERYRRRSWKIAYNIVGNMEVARDISQEGFVRVLRGISACDPKRGFRQWFDRVVVNLSIDYLRKYRDIRSVPLELIAEPPARAEEPDASSLREEGRLRVREVLAHLPFKHRMVLTMRDIDGMACDEIARVLGKSSGTVRWRLNRARQAFKRLWERSETSAKET